MHQHCLKTWSRHFTAFNTRKTKLLLQRYPSHLRFVQQQSLSSYLRHESSSSHTQVSLHLGSHHTATISINQSNQDSPDHGKQQNPSDFGWCTAAGGCLPLFDRSPPGRSHKSSSHEMESRRDFETDDSCGDQHRFSAGGITSLTFACFSRKPARSTRTVSAVSPDTDGSKPVTLHGQHPGHQLTALTQSEVDHLGQTLSRKQEPAEQLNLSFSSSTSPPSKSHPSWVCPHLDGPDPVHIPLSHPQSRLSLPPAKTSPVPVRTH